MARTILLADVAGLSGSLPGRLAARIFCGIIKHEYLGRYFRGRPTEREALWAWLPVLAAPRWSEGIPEERAALLSIIHNGLKKGTRL